VSASFRNLGAGLIFYVRHAVGILLSFDCRAVFQAEGRRSAKWFAMDPANGSPLISDKQ
jgi:hypothetical protein